MSLYVKAFGDELAYYNYKDANVLDNIKEMMNLEKLMQNLENMKTVSFQCRVSLLFWQRNIRF